MKKTINLAFVAILCLCFIGLAWAGGQKEVTGGDELPSYVVKAGCLHGTDHANFKGVNKLKEVLEADSKGRITVEIYPAGQLGTDPEMLDQVKMGTLHFTIGGKVSHFCPELNAFALPFLLKDLEHAEKVLNGSLGDEYAKKAEKNGYKILAYVHNGFRQFTNNLHPIKTPSDLKGLKMRVPPMDIMLKTMDAMGATVTPIAFSELYMALRTKVVDGEENPYMQILDEKFYEVQKYMTVVNYLYPVNAYVTNPGWFNGLSEIDQALVLKAARAGAEFANNIYETRESTQLKELQNLMEVYIPSDEELNQFKSMVQPVYDWAIGEGYITQKTIEEIRAMAK